MYFWRFFNMSLTPQDAKKKTEKSGKKGVKKREKSKIKK